jgi:TRAP-type C4-dicarboxylate transport system permease small subunit
MSDLRAIETKLSNLLEQFLTLLLFLIFAIIVLLVILRYVFNTTIIGGNEGALIAFVYTTAIGGALAVARQEHIAIHYFVDLSPVRTQHHLKILQLVLVAAMNLAIVWYSIAWIGRTGAFLMPALQLPQLVAQLSVPVGCGMAFVYCVIGIRRRISS